MPEQQTIYWVVPLTNEYYYKQTNQINRNQFVRMFKMIEFVTKANVLHNQNVCIFRNICSNCLSLTEVLVFWSLFSVYFFFIFLNSKHCASACIWTEIEPSLPEMRMIKWGKLMPFDCGVTVACDKKRVLYFKLKLCAVYPVIRVRISFCS